MVCFLFFLLSCFSRGNRNYDNLIKIRKGMPIGEVNRIMGNPDSILIHFFDESQFSYMYQAPYGSSENIYINFYDSDSSVASIINSD